MSGPEPGETFADFLTAVYQRHRVAYGMSLKAFSNEILGIDHSQVSRYQRGEVLPDLETARQIAPRLDLTLAQMDALLAASRQSRRRPGSTIQTKSGTLRITDQRLSAMVFALVARWDAMSDEERAGFYAEWPTAVPVAVGHDGDGRAAS